MPTLAVAPIEVAPPNAIVQSGVVPYRLSTGRLRILLITSRSGRRWLVPKGHVEEPLTPQASAAKEALEEAGVAGMVDPRPLGCCRELKRGALRVIHLYAMSVTKTHKSWPEMQDRRREWLPRDAAMKRLEHPAMADCIAELARRVAVDRA